MLHVVDILDLFKKVVLFVVQGHRGNQRAFVLLVHANQAIEHISWLHGCPMLDQMRRVAHDRVLKEVVNLDDA